MKERAIKERAIKAWPEWTIGECIGRGGFGAVYEMRRDVFGDIEKSALKVISIPADNGEIEYMKSEGLDEESISQVFHSQVGEIIKEYKLMKRMSENTHIVHCDDFKFVQHPTDPGWDICIKMELLTPLMNGLNRMKDEKEIIRLGIELCDALKSCQKHNIIHRDIKPQNIFISPEGNFKLGDFGIARMMENTSRAQTRTGTLNFMAPEVIKGFYTSTVDIYSLGLVLYWLLNERRGPFLPLPPTNPSYAVYEKATYRRFSGEQLPRPKNGSDSLQAVVMKACSYTPEDRYQTAQEMMEALLKLWKRDGTEQHDGENEDSVGSQRSLDSIGATAFMEEDDPHTVLERYEKIPKSKDCELNTNSALDITVANKKTAMILYGIVAVIAVVVGMLLWKPGNPESADQTSSQSEPILIPSYSSIESPNDSLDGWETNTSADIIKHEENNPQIREPEQTEIEIKPTILERKCLEIDAGDKHTVVLYNDGTVDAVGNNDFGQCDVKNWKNIVQISTLDNHTVGLCSDGTVVAVGDNEHGQCEVSDWTEIIAVSAGVYHTLGLKSDGTVVGTGFNGAGQCNVYDWHDIVAIGSGHYNSFGLHSDGTVIVAGVAMDFEVDENNLISGWENICSISVGYYHIIGICEDGTLISEGNNSWGQCNIYGFKYITNVDAGPCCTVVQGSDGAYVKGVIDPKQERLPSGVLAASAVIDVAAGGNHVVAVRDDGTFVAAGANDDGQCDVSVFSW